jgi:hypothetical protein
VRNPHRTTTTSAAIPLPHVTAPHSFCPTRLRPAHQPLPVLLPAALLLLLQVKVSLGLTLT